MELLLGQSVQVLMSTNLDQLKLKGEVVYQSPKYPYDLIIFAKNKLNRIGEALIKVKDRVIYTRKRNIQVLRLGKHPVTLI